MLSRKMFYDFYMLTLEHYPEDPEGDEIDFLFESCFFKEIPESMQSQYINSLPESVKKEYASIYYPIWESWKKWSWDKVTNPFSFFKSKPVIPQVDEKKEQEPSPLSNNQDQAQSVSIVLELKQISMKRE